MNTKNKCMYCAKGAVIKYEADQGGRDCTGPPKILGENVGLPKYFLLKRWAIKFNLKIVQKFTESVTLQSLLS